MIIDSEELKGMIENLMEDNFSKERLFYLIDTMEEVNIPDRFDVIPIEWINKWGKRANREYHIALLVHDWNERYGRYVPK